MFHEMRRKDRLLSEEEAMAILEKGEYGVLSTIGEDGWPYGVPISYACRDNCIYFHMAEGVGHKLENIAHNSRACFTVVGDTLVIPEKFGTLYESVVAFGEVRPVEDKLESIEILRQKYSPAFEAEGKAYAQRAQAGFAVYCLHIEHITGKARRK